MYRLTSCLQLIAYNQNKSLGGRYANVCLMQSCKYNTLCDNNYIFTRYPVMETYYSPCRECSVTLLLTGHYCM